MKKILISRISPCCLLDYANMSFWINNLKGVSAGTKSLILDYLQQNGQLTGPGWKVLAQAITLEPGSPITKDDIIEWATNNSAMTCPQLTAIIQNTQLQANFIPMEYPPFELVELNISFPGVYRFDGEQDDYQKTMYTQYGITPGQFAKLVIKKPTFHIKNFDLIREANPYLVIERYKSGSTRQGRKSKWRRAPSFTFGDFYYDGWQKEQRKVTVMEMMRPNNIPLTSPNQIIDMFIENYIQIPIGSKKIPKFVGDKSNKPYRKTTKFSTKVPLRFRIGFTIDGKEYLSKPLLYTNIKANTTEELAPPSNEVTIVVGFGKP